MGGILPLLAVWLITGCATNFTTHRSGVHAPAAWANSLGMKFVRIPAGEFTMGSPVTEKERSTNEVQHLVKMTQPYWFGATHVTVRQFSDFATRSGYRTAAEKEGWAYGIWNSRENRWNRHDGASWKKPGFPFSQGGDHPVVCVDWNDAMAFCNWLSKLEGRNYRLPTEAEWEYACRAGTSMAYPWGDNPEDGKGWVNGSDAGSASLFPMFPAFSWDDGFLYTSPVETFHTNSWGIHDPLGNVLQWCSDWFGDYPGSGVENPDGPAEGRERILRGGSFIYGPQRTRLAFRGRNSPDFRNYYVGFRVVLGMSR